MSTLPTLPEFKAEGTSSARAEQPVSKVKFTESELVDTIVIDSEGYVVGKIESLRIEPEEIFIKLYGIEKEKRQVIDKEALMERIAKIAPAKRSNIDYEPRSVDVTRMVREHLGLGAGAQVTDDQICHYAESLGLSIPYTMKEKDGRVDRGSIPWALVDRVGSSDYGRAVILREPYEARKRGVELRDGVPPYRSKTELEGKLIVDSEAKPTGTAVEILIGITHGVLVRKESYKQEESLDLEKLKRSLVPSRFRDFEDFKKKIGKDLDKKTVGIPEIQAWCKRYNIALPVIRQTKVVTDFEFSVDWKDIAKIGDVIILSRTIEELAKGQMSQKNLELVLQ
jgi:sporulation protein YlmC with PRC-barrel domain